LDILKRKEKIASICKAVQYSIMLELLFIYRRKKTKKICLYMSADARALKMYMAGRRQVKIQYIAVNQKQ